MNRRYDSNTSFLDLLFNTLLGFVALFVLAFAMINVSKQSKNVEAKADFIVTITWPKDFDDDVDTYVEDPNGRLVCFRRREDGLMHLDRDDLGKRNDKIQTLHGLIEYNENREMVTLRGTSEGEYTVNVHMYLKNDPRPVPVTIQVDKINPFSTVAIKTVVLEKNGEEKTATRFTVGEKGIVVSVNDLEKSLVKLQFENENEFGYPTDDFENQFNDKESP